MNYHHFSSAKMKFVDLKLRLLLLDTLYKKTMLNENYQMTSQIIWLKVSITGTCTAL